MLEYPANSTATEAVDIFKVKNTVSIGNLQIKIFVQLKDFCHTAAIIQIRTGHKLKIQIKIPVMLFIGNPGTGKTSVAKIVAGNYILIILTNCKVLCILLQLSTVYFTTKY